jgi:hypothetical protein
MLAIIGIAWGSGFPGSRRFAADDACLLTFQLTSLGVLGAAGNNEPGTEAANCLAA